MDIHEAREIAARCWCAPTTSHCIMQPEVAEEVAQVLFRQASGMGEAGTCSSCANDPRKASIGNSFARWLNTPAGQKMSYADVHDWDHNAPFFKQAFEAGWAFLVATLTGDIEPVLAVSGTGNETVGTIVASLQREDGALLAVKSAELPPGYLVHHDWLWRVRDLLNKLGMDPNHENVNTPEKAFAYIHEAIDAIRANKPVVEVVGCSPKE